MVNPNTFAYTSWWSELNHFGQTLHAGHAPKLTLADPPAKSWVALAEALPDFRAWTELGASKREKHLDPLHRWLDAVLEGYLGHSPQDFLKHSAIGEAWKVVGPDGRALKPERLVRLNPPNEEHALPIFITSAPLNQKDGKRRALDLDRFLRAKQLPMGIITDGRSLRWVVAGTHQNAFTQWDLLAGWGEGEAWLPWRGLYTLFGRHQGWAATPDKDRPHQLGLWLQESGQMQGDLSTSLGEQIREAVEALVHALDRWSMEDATRLAPLVEAEPDPLKQNHALYTAAVRLVMRLVVIAFAESRGLLPVTLAAYRDSYGLEVLWQRLKRAKGEVGFEHQRSAWVQLLGLFRLVHDGCAHPDLNLRAYGGDLFRPGDPTDLDPVSRALALWESVDGVPVSDKDVLQVLDRLKRTTVRVNGKAVATPVDFSTLSTEYIGLLYEGLLDYDLRTAAEPMLLLNLGQQPLLPLTLLQAKNEKETKELLETLAKEKATKASSDEEGDDEDEESEEEVVEEPEADASEPSPEDEPTPEDGPEEVPVELMSQAWAWASEAAALMPSRFGLPNLKRGQTKAQKPDDMDTQEWADRLSRAARNLVARVIPPGERYLIRWSGTRKGSGTFYTRPALTEPLIRETLRPLCFETDGTPKKPEAILSLRVLDPAMGSASFLVGALRYLTHALYDSLIHHRLREDRPDRVILTLPFGLPALGSPGESLPPVHPDDPAAEPKLKRRLKRFVVERCIYGVDINALAVDLAKLAVWVETLDPDLPFGFLDHKLRCGNGLVGCWLDRVDDYPILAWDREGGDGKTGTETKALKEAFKAAKKVLEGQLFRGTSWVMAPDHKAPEEVLPAARRALGELHDIPIHDVDQQRDAWTALAADPALHALQHALDRWCALFFWPGVDDGGQSLKPESLPMPDSWQDPVFTPTIQRLAVRHRFFHWELAFPEVFTGPESGFDVVLGNPPWDTLQPESLEFFTRFDPIYRTYTPGDAKRAQQELFSHDPAIERAWLAYVGEVRAVSSFLKAAADPFHVSFGKGKDQLSRGWESKRAARAAYSDPEHPFCIQGDGKTYTYKLFAELSRVLLRPGGRMGLVTPAGLYSDAWATVMRRTFLIRDQWELLYGFENKKEIFKIHRQFKFVATVIAKGVPAVDRPLQAAFMRLDISELNDPLTRTLPVSIQQIRRFAPNSLSLMEFRSHMDLEVANKLYADHELLKVQVRHEFHMTNDSRLWKDGSRKRLQEIGVLAPLEDTRDVRVRFRLWQMGWVPLTEGKHYWQFNPYYLGNDTENGFRKFLDGQKFIPRETLRKVAEDNWAKAKEAAEKRDEPFEKSRLDFMAWVRPRLLFRDVQNATNLRTFILTLAPANPHGNASPDLSTPIIDDYYLAGVLDSFCIDWIIRRKITAHLNKFYVETLPIPFLDDPLLTEAIQARVAPNFGVWAPPISDTPTRLKMRIEMDALVALTFKLPVELFEHILLDPLAKPKGFDRVDEDLPEPHRQPLLTLGAYKQLIDKGLNRFLHEGVEVPEAALGHRRPLIEIWSPADGWDTAWAEARAMAASDHEWDLFLGKEHAVQAEYGNIGGAINMAASPEHGKDPYRADPQPGALFDLDEFRQDGQRRLL
ncbi:Eco57I restriction-modification methylase domain-containing protein [Holophaga foetida]|uniref:Eco57I restriction-modification methylase domain-containing protein n=1 Tax=Holophaga foetida TaxID=35839 RepID=UPI0002473345|nr:hypothetical protein [Holophaga foetida]